MITNTAGPEPFLLPTPELLPNYFWLARNGMIILLKTNFRLLTICITICRLFSCAIGRDHTLQHNHRDRWQVLSHPHLLPYPAPSASCLVLNFLLYKPFVATLCGEINFKIKQTYEDELKRGGDLLSWNRWPFSRVIGVLLLSSCSRADHSLASQLILRTSPRKSWVFLWFAPSSTCHQGQALLGSSPEPSDGVTAHP